MLVAGLLFLVVCQGSESPNACEPKPPTEQPPAKSTEPPAATSTNGPTAPSLDETDPMGANGACYVCHIPFVKEEMAKVHLKAEVPCIKCHGPSEAHANDENIGATKPDKLFAREKIDPMCIECHETHDAPVPKVITRFIERKLPTKTPPICTECHGTHKIERPEEIASKGA